jgi:hypothetical protein
VGSFQTTDARNEHILFREVIATGLALLNNGAKLENETLDYSLGRGATKDSPRNSIVIISLPSWKFGPCEKLDGKKHSLYPKRDRRNWFSAIEKLVRVRLELKGMPLSIESKAKGYRLVSRLHICPERTD